MKRNKILTMILSVLMAVLLACLLAGCGKGEDAEDVASGEALTEEEYQDAVAKLGEDFTALQDEANNVDTSDVEAAVKLLESLKAPLNDFINIIPPDAYAAAHEKLQSGSRAMIGYIDAVISMVSETDQTKIAEFATKMMEFVQTAMNDLTEGAEMLTEATGS